MKNFPYFLFLGLVSLLISCRAERTEELLAYKIREPQVAIENPPLLILLHGLGGSEEDLYQLAEYLPDEYLVIFPRGPYAYEGGGYAWYAIQLAAGEIISNVEEARQSRQQLAGFLDQLQTIHDFDTEKIILGGFSQGAIMSYTLGLTAPDKLAGIIALSGRLLDGDQAPAQTAPYTTLKTLIIHGVEDDILSIDYARTAKTFWEGLTAPVEYHELQMGHVLEGQTVQLMRDWLRDF